MCVAWGSLGGIVGIVEGNAMGIIAPISACLIFVLFRLSFESYNMLVDTADSSIAQVQLQQELSEKTDKTNTLLHHIYQNSRKVVQNPPLTS